MIRERLERIIRKKCTLLGVGPMSQMCVDVAIELANLYQIPILLIASRRQVDSAEMGGGYVNQWTTETFAEYVMERDKGGQILLCRDHGGPWQSVLEQEQSLGLAKAMKSAKRSYEADIEAGFQILHLDPSVDIHGNPDQQEIIDRVLELYEFCWETACKFGQKIEFEIGTEEQSGRTSGGREFEQMLEKIRRHCARYRMPDPLFVVVQNGTKVVETRNVGSFDVPVRVAGEIPPEIQMPMISQICARNGIYVKAHNTDYLSDASLTWYPRLGIHAANVAPEFGVVETRAWLQILEERELGSFAKQFQQLAYDSGKWKKWMLPETKASDREKAIIAGHYIFSSPECLELKEKANRELRKKGVELEAELKEKIRASILRYLTCFRMVRK